MRRKNLGSTPRFRAQETRAERGITEGSFDFIASDESVDRFGDVILADGWQLANFRRNPVLLLGHDYQLPAIGQVGRINTEDLFGGPALVARAVTFGRSALAQAVQEALEDRDMSACSVGFVSLRAHQATPEDIKRFRMHEAPGGPGMIHEQSELLELSIVSVPANPNALAVRGQRSFAPAELEQTLTIARSIRKFDFELARRMENSVARVERLKLVCAVAPISRACKQAEREVFDRVVRLAAETARLVSTDEPDSLAALLSEETEGDPWGLSALLEELEATPAPEDGDPIEKARAKALAVSRNLAQLR